MNLGVKTIIGYDKRILGEATRTRPIYATAIGYNQNLSSVQESCGKNTSDVLISYSADWLIRKFACCKEMAAWKEKRMKTERV